MANLKRYNPGENYYGEWEENECADGYWVKFDDIKEHLPSASHNPSSPKSCSTCAQSDKEYSSDCFSWPECSLTFDKWKKGKTSA